MEQYATLDLALQPVETAPKVDLPELATGCSSCCAAAGTPHTPAK
jgi:hypothetical protein